jgi:hypothetical protein
MVTQCYVICTLPVLFKFCLMMLSLAKIIQQLCLIFRFICHIFTYLQNNQCGNFMHCGGRYLTHAAHTWVGRKSNMQEATPVCLSLSSYLDIMCHRMCLSCTFQCVELIVALIF